jgi:hypothetical protein
LLGSSSGGEGGIRTHGTVAGTTVFKTVSLNHSDTSPWIREIIADLQANLNGGERGIRTLETIARLHAFQACQFNHSCISPSARTILADVFVLFLSLLMLGFRQ